MQKSIANNDSNDARFSYQNAAQAQHAHKLAIQATPQDPKITEAIALASIIKDPQDIQNAKVLFPDKMDMLSKQISNMRAADMGWGKIAKQLNVHPFYSAKGQSMIFGKNDIFYNNHEISKTKNEAANTRSQKEKSAKGHNARGSKSKSKSLGLARAENHGHSKGRGVASGHRRGAGSGTLAGQSAGHGNGHGDGQGGGCGGGHGGGNGNGK